MHTDRSSAGCGTAGHDRSARHCGSRRTARRWVRSRVYDVIVGRTGTAFGQSVNPHLFRDCAATSIAIDDPAHVRIASQILGHRSTATTERYYNQAQAIDAARRYQDFLVGLRNGTMTDRPGTCESR